MIKKIGFKLLIGLLAMACTFNAQAQDKPAPSPLGKVYQRLGVTDVEVTYSRPGVKERSIFAADGLVPYGKVWRTGANAATKISFSTPVMIGGKTLPAGDYGIYSIPGEEEWTVIFSKKMTSANGYDKANDAARVTVKPGELPWSIETFTMAFGNVKPTSMDLSIFWEKALVSVPISVEKTWE